MEGEVQGRKERPKGENTPLCNTQNSTEFENTWL